MDLQLRVQFKNERFFRRERPHKVFRRDVLNVRRSRKAAENDARRKKGLLLNGQELEGRQMQQKHASVAKDTRSHLKNRILVQGQGETEFQPADILKYFEELERGLNTEIGTKDFF